MAPDGTRVSPQTEPRALECDAQPCNNPGKYICYKFLLLRRWNAQACTRPRTSHFSAQQADYEHELLVVHSKTRSRGVTASDLCPKGVRSPLHPASVESSGFVLRQCLKYSDYGGRPVQADMAAPLARHPAGPTPLWASTGSATSTTSTSDCVPDATATLDADWQRDGDECGRALRRARASAGGHLLAAQLSSGGRAVCKVVGCVADLSQVSESRGLESAVPARRDADHAAVRAASAACTFQWLCACPQQCVELCGWVVPADAAVAFVLHLPEYTNIPFRAKPQASGYLRRYRVCSAHHKAPAVQLPEGMGRFCQQCGRFHKLSAFDGDKRSCRDRLKRHNVLRRKEADCAGKGAHSSGSSGSGSSSADEGGAASQVARWQPARSALLAAPSAPATRLRPRPRTPQPHWPRRPQQTLSSPGRRRPHSQRRSPQHRRQPPLPRPASGAPRPSWPPSSRCVVPRPGRSRWLALQRALPHRPAVWRPARRCAPAARSAAALPPSTPSSRGPGLGPCPLPRARPRLRSAAALPRPAA